MVVQKVLRAFYNVQDAAVTSPAPSAAPSLLSPGPAVEDDDEAWWGADEPESPVEPGLSI